MRCGDLWQDHGLVLSSGVGTPVLRGDLNCAKVLLKRAGFPQSFRFHDLRHTCATLLLRLAFKLGG
jgi:integrase